MFEIQFGNWSCRVLSSISLPWFQKPGDFEFEKKRSKQQKKKKIIRCVCISEAFTCTNPSLRKDGAEILFRSGLFLLTGTTIVF